MAQLRKINTAGSPSTPRARTSPTFEQLLQGDASTWATSSPTLGKDHDHHNKKSVLTKVKETAKKVKNTLSKKKHGPEDDGSSPYGANLDDDDDDEEDEDPEYLGAPMYESELAPEACKETARQHPRATPVVSEKHAVPNNFKNEIEQDREKTVSPNKTITETVSEKLGPAYVAVTDATHAIASKIAGLTVATDTGGDCADNGMLKLGRGTETWDKGVSVKEYLMHKLEPGEDEKALSQVITEAISPRKTAGDLGVVEKVKEAVTSLLRNDDPSSQSPTMASNLSSSPRSSQSATMASNLSSSPRSSQSATMASNLSSSPIPVSTNPHRETEEENHGRILQVTEVVEESHGRILQAN